MFCKTCGTACKDDQNYCHNDGTNLSVFGNVAIEFHGKSFCPGCGASSEKNGSYCPSCGRSNSNVVADNRVSPINIPEINMKNFDNSLIKNIMRDGFRKDYFFSDEFKKDIKNVGLSLILTFVIAFFISLIVKQMVESSMIDSLISDIFPSGSDAIDKIISSFSIFTIMHGGRGIVRVDEGAMSVILRLMLLSIIPAISIFIIKTKQLNKIYNQSSNVGFNLYGIISLGLIYSFVVYLISLVPSYTYNGDYSTYKFSYSSNVFFYAFAIYLIGTVTSYIFIKAVKEKDVYYKVAGIAIMFNAVGVIVSGIIAKIFLNDSIADFSSLSFLIGGLSSVMNYVDKLGNIFLLNIGEYLFKFSSFVSLSLTYDGQEIFAKNLISMEINKVYLLSLLIVIVNIAIGYLISKEYYNLNKIKLLSIYFIVYSTFSFITSYSNKISVSVIEYIDSSPEVLLNFSSKGIQSFFVAGLIATAAFGVGLMLKETLEKYKK